ncbi:MAG: ATP-binding protein [Planctomycetota bacterium]|jgi:NAD-dependent dihydropyrimidine dehydrogenase PreA subunit
MAGQKKLTVVISQHQGRNPAKRKLEEDIAVALMMNPDVEVSIIPNLYDLSADHSGTLFLKAIKGDLVVLGWLYPRAIQWVLDRNGIKGHAGTVLLKSGEEDESDEEFEVSDDAIGALDVPDRLLYPIDLKASTDAQAFLNEIHRISDETSQQTVDLLSWIQGSPKQEQLERYLNPKAVLDAGSGNNGTVADAESDEKVRRRWYPVIDYDRCTNCMECIDFCLFGVYGVDFLDRILVENQDSCKKGCPACSRVCPENAIVFPQHKDSAIAGADGEVANLKIDLSQLFGGGDAVDMAVKERDIELVRDGRDAVGASVGLRKRSTCGERDELDDLIDGLDDLDL